MSTSPSEGYFIGLIADGSRRFESQRLHEEQRITVSSQKLSEVQLYEAVKQGSTAIKHVMECAREQAIGIFAPWGWSTKNWDRGEAAQRVTFQVIHEFLLDLEKNWMNLPENSDVRLVHMGRAERIEKADPALHESIQRVCYTTQERMGMVVAVCLDYSGPDELRRAEALWRSSGGKGQLCDHFDLPRQGVAYRPVDLRIRTGEETELKHSNGYLLPYVDEETRDQYHSAYLPQYTPEMFLADIERLSQTSKREGK